MAVRYTRSTDGSDADGGTTWALAKATLAGVAAIDTAGDTLWVSQAHAQSGAGAMTLAFAGTLASPTRLLCGNDAAEPPTALATTATVTCSDNNLISIQGALYCYGIAFISAGGIEPNGSAANVNQQFEQCSFQTTNPGSGGYVNLNSGNNNTNDLRLRSCTFKFAHANNTVLVRGNTVIEGGSIVSGTTTPTSLFFFVGDRQCSRLLVDGFDFSNFSAGFNLFGIGSAVSPGIGIIRNCKLPASWSGVLVASGITAPGMRYEMRNCDAAGTNYRLWVEDYAGTIKNETTIVRTSGASDGTTPLSWKMSTSADAKFPLIPLESPEIEVWNDTTGSSVTVTVEIVHDTNVAAGQGAGTANAFRDDEVWLEVQYLGASGAPLSTFVRDSVADVLATAADQASSSVAWTTTGLTTPQKQALSVTFTPQMKGPIVAKVKLAKASKTIYVDPLLVLS